MLKFVTHATEPRVGQRLVQSDALLWLFDQQAEDQVLALLRVIGPLGRVEDDAVFTRHANRFFLRIVIEGKRAA